MQSQIQINSNMVILNIFLIKQKTKTCFYKQIKIFDKFNLILTDTQYMLSMFKFESDISITLTNYQWYKMDLLVLKCNTNIKKCFSHNFL